MRTGSKVFYGAALMLSLSGAGASAHECRSLGQTNSWDVPHYLLCVGFQYEDANRPRAGARNNVDIFPIYVTPQGDHPLNTTKGDIVDLKVRIEYLSAPYYSVPHDANWNVTVPWFFFKQANTGFDNPLGFPRFARDLPALVPTLEPDGYVAYRSPTEFVTPYPGQYAYYVEGVLKLKGNYPPQVIKTKWVSNQPRIPYGPSSANGSVIRELTQAPEGWFDAVKPGFASRVAGSSGPSSPPVSVILKRLKAK